MTDDIDYCVIQTDGKDEFQCKHCDTKYGIQKSIKTHVTIKHKVEKSGKKPPADEKGATSASPELGNDSSDPALSGFDFETVPKSTQITPVEHARKSKTTEEILEEYESVELDESVTVEDIPDDTVDQIIAGIDENEQSKSTDDQEKLMEDDASPPEDEKKELKDTIQALESKHEESEENSLKAQ